MRATIKMIAERAGVSIGTVDRVLHDRPYVKEEVRRRVLEVMENKHYEPYQQIIQRKKTQYPVGIFLRRRSDTGKRTSNHTHA